MRYESLNCCSLDLHSDPLAQAFTIYAFFQLLINFLGGERSLIIMTHGRPPVSHPWPISHCLPKVDISDPYTFLTIKRGILQYAWIKPLLALATIAMKATGTFEEGSLSPTGGYLWTGIVFNLSITISLYALAMFWVCMRIDLRPFRPMPKFLCIKGIIFASYWQGFFLSILVFLGAIPNGVDDENSSTNLAVAIQDALICFEMPLFAILHWYAFSWHDYADATISAARMPVKYALKDAFGSRDLIQDAKETFAGKQYDYRYFDAGEDILAHEESGQRAARMSQGMRYERKGKGKYWIPKPGQADSRKPLLHHSSDEEDSSPSSTTGRAPAHYGSFADDLAYGFSIDPEDERLFTNARDLEFGDWNYPVITAHHATREDRLYREPRVVTTSSNRNLLQPTKDGRKKKNERSESIQKSAANGKAQQLNTKQTQGNSNDRGNARQEGSNRSIKGDGPVKEDQSQRRDLVVEDVEAEDVERVRARKSGSPEWNRNDRKHFLRAYPEEPLADPVHHANDGMMQGSTQGLEETQQTEDNFEERPQWANGDESRGAEERFDDRQIYVDEETNIWALPKK